MVQWYKEVLMEDMDQMDKMEKKMRMELFLTPML